MLRKHFISAGRILLPLLVVSNVAFCDTLKIYENLVQCYRENNTTPILIENSLQILLELIRKIENYYPTSLDIRTLSVNLVHRLRIDGIQRAPGIHETEFITPYRPIGIQTPKFELLLKLISDVPGDLKFEEILSSTELCTLHKLISSSVEPFKRGDEQSTCVGINRDSSNLIDTSKVKVFPNGQTYVIPGSISRCPIEMGVIRTLHYSSLSPGTVIASIAAGLEPQSVSIKELFPTIKNEPNLYGNLETNENYQTEQFVRKLSQSLDTIDNTYAAGLAGDLAEVCVYQAPYGIENVTVGLPGFWNDTQYPLIRYLPESYQLKWAMPDSEILAGIDSFHLGIHIRPMVNRIRRMRLSQVIEMYYSPRGIPNFIIENANRNKRPSYFGGFQQDEWKKSLKDEEHLKAMNNQFRRPAEITSQLYGAPEDFGSLYRRTYYDPERYMLGNNIDSACERKQILNRMSKDQLKEQTYFFAQVLQYSTRTMTVDDGLIKSVCDLAVDKFFIRAKKLLDELPDCNKIGSNYIRPTIDLTLIIDGSRTKYENLKLISFLSELIDVSYYGSKISVIQGTTGEYLVRPTNSIVSAFEQLRFYRGSYPTTLSLADSFTTILNSLESREEEKRRKQQIIGTSKVILVVSQSQKIRENDFQSAKRMIEGSFQAFTDLYFAFLTNDVPMFEEMTKQAALQSKTQYNIINAPNTDPQTFKTSLSQVLRIIPKWIRLPDYNEMKELKKHVRQPGDPIDGTSPLSLLNFFEYEEYISLNERISYKIDGKLILGAPSEFQIEFEISEDYGEITVCLTKNQNDYQCQSTMVNNPVQFNIMKICNQEQQQQQEPIQSCPSLIFKVDMDNSKMKCTENDCRYPDQVRYLVRFRNFYYGNNSTNLMISSVVFIIVMLNHVIFSRILFFC